MSFFNKKEEVIDLQLTQHGKHLLSLGKMKPVYYSFFDDNVLYDSQYASISESRNDIETRIQDDTPYIKTQYVFSGRESNLKKIIKQNKYNLDVPETERVSIPNTTEKHYSLVSPIGTADLDNNKSSAFQLTFINGEIQSCSNTSVGAFATQKIPQINTNLEFKIIKKNTSDEQPIAEEFRDIQTNVLLDGTYFEIVENDLILHIIEKNTDFEKENFDIELFIVEQEDVSGSINTPGISKSTKREILIPLLFTKEPEQIINNILLDQTTFNQIDDVTPSYVEYYFDLRVDDEIIEYELCSKITKFKSQNKFIDDEFNCEEQQKALQRVNIYSSNISNQDIEQCDI